MGVDILKPVGGGGSRSFFFSLPESLRRPLGSSSSTSKRIKCAFPFSYLQKPIAATVEGGQNGRMDVAAVDALKRKKEEIQTMKSKGTDII